MPEIDDELVARAIRWCADAGRQATPAEVRSALAPLSWDQLLAARAALADPPPARPLGPAALADLARGTLPDVAAEREREGRYVAEGTAPAGGPVGVPAGVATPPGATAPPSATRASGRRGLARAPAAPVIRRARDRVDAAPAPARTLPLVDELLASEGRAVLQRLVREHGARRGGLLAALAAGWRRGDGGPPRDEDLGRLLDAHGLSRWFERRERDELLHAVRAAAGMLTVAARSLGLDAGELGRALERLGARGQAEAIRTVHQGELRHRATLAERVRLLLAEPERLADLELKDEIELDLRQRLPEHVRALRASGAAPLLPALAHSLGTTPRELAALAAGLGLDLERVEAAAVPPAGTAMAPAAPRAGAAPRSAHRREPSARSGRDVASSRRGGPAPGERRRPGEPARRDAGRRSPGARPSGPRPTGAAPAGSRPGKQGARPPARRGGGPSRRPRPR